MSMLLLGIDVGTSGAKAVLIDEFGTTVATASANYPLSTPKPNWVEQNPADWWNAVTKICRELLSSPNVIPAQIKAIGLSGQMHTSVLLDKDKAALRPAILWSDTRTDKECLWLREKIGLDKMNALVANPPLEGFTLPKLLWLRNNEPDVFERITTVLLPKDYIRYRMTGEIATEVSDAAGTLMFDVRTREWSSELLRLVSIPQGWLPRVYESTEICGIISREASQETGLPEGIPVVGGGADNTCGAVGTGIISEGRVLASIGTSGVVFAHTDRILVEPKMRVHSFCHSVPNRWYLMGVMLMAGGALRWFRDTFCMVEIASAHAHGIDPYELIIAGARSVPAGCEGLFFQPYLAGERTPHQSATARAAFIGATIRHTKEHFSRAVLEGITFGMRDSLEIIRSMGITIDQIRLIGGGAKSKFWRQLQADIYGSEVLTVNTKEGPAFGAALLAGVGAKVFLHLEEAVGQTVHIDDRIQPNTEMTNRYNEYYSIYTQLFPSLEAVNSTIHRTFRELPSS